MGKIKCESHCSHPHPLTLIPHDHTHNISPASCSGCKLQLSGMIYSCTTCTFFLHRRCFEMPTRITHPFHKDHALTLLPEPAYAGGEFNCDACAERGAGFSYHCKPCGLDLHILCAAAPLSLETACHAHKLYLTFGSPYDSKIFACDVCAGGGGDHWLYRCSACGFDAHLKCASGATRQVAAAASSRSAPAPQPHGGGQHFVAPPPHPGMGGAAFGVPAGGMAMGVNGQNNMALQAIMQMVQNNNAMAQAIMAGGGMGGAGGDRGMQQMMQLMSALNRSGGIPGLDVFGGGGGLNSLQSLLGGGGGLDSLQSLLGGGGLDFLGGGGLDFLGGLF